MFSIILYSNQLLNSSSSNNFSKEVNEKDILIKPFDNPGNFSFDQESEKFQQDKSFSIKLVKINLKKIKMYLSTEKNLDNNFVQNMNYLDRGNDDSISLGFNLGSKE